MILSDIKILGIWLMTALPMLLTAQINPEILLNNPSFEGRRSQGIPPSGWFDCGFVNETPPDVQPGFFSVTRSASEGSTYLGMVVRDNETWESVGQRLSMALIRNHCYELSIDLCHSESYWSISKRTNEKVNFDEPVMMRIWGGYRYCDRVEQLAEAGPINHPEWRNYTLQMRPLMGNYTHIIIEAYYKPRTNFAYNGNLLLDNLSYIRELPCPAPPPVPTVVNNIKKNPVKPDSNTRIKPTPKPQVTRSVETVTPVVVAPPLAETEIPKPVTIRKSNQISKKILYFEVNQYDIPDEYQAYLKEMAEYLKTSSVMIEAGGHTNNNAADNFAIELSEKRAKTVANRLIELGAPKERVTFKGYGKTQPLDSNLAEKGREKNQRVEIIVWKTEE